MTRSMKKIKRVDHKNHAKWSDLPGDILQEIFRKLKDHSDIYGCGTVCVSWQSIVKNMLPQFLFLSNNNIHNNKSCILFNPISNRAREISLPEGLFLSSSFGWLLSVSISPPHRINLFNPFASERKEIALPPAATKFKSPEELRVITSTSPLDPKCWFLAMDTHTLAFCRRDDKSWTINRKNVMENDFWSRQRKYDGRAFCDAIFYQGHFYAVNLYGELFRLHFGPRPEAEELKIQLQIPWPLCNILTHHYLVELEGKLLLVVRGRHYNCWRRKFYVFEWNQDKEKWIEVKSIGDNVIVLGKCSSESLPGKGRF